MNKTSNAPAAVTPAPRAAKVKAITFPAFTKGIRRNAETGVEIHKDGTDGYAVVVPSRDGRTAPVLCLTLADARREAKVRAETWREAIAAAYDEAAEILLAEVAETVEDQGPLVNRAISTLLSGARRSAESGYLGAAARRLNSARNMLNGVGFISDEDAAAALAATAGRFPLGQRVRTGRSDVPLAVADRVPYVEAETNRVILPLEARINGRKVYFSAYADTLYCV